MDSFSVTMHMNGLLGIYILFTEQSSLIVNNYDELVQIVCYTVNHVSIIVICRVYSIIIR